MHIDYRGTLLPISHAELPFTPLRTFVVCNVPVGTIRGGHAHYKTKQFAYVVHGEISFDLYDGLCTHQKHAKAGDTILIPELVWDRQKFITEGAVLLVFCSTEYNQDDYIFDKQFFENLKRQ